jgi:hypothetical protein
MTYKQHQLQLSNQPIGRERGKEGRKKKWKKIQKRENINNDLE